MFFDFISNSIPEIVLDCLFEALDMLSAKCDKSLEPDQGNIIYPTVGDVGGCSSPDYDSDNAPNQEQPCSKASWRAYNEDIERVNDENLARWTTFNSTGGVLPGFASSERTAWLLSRRIILAAVFAVTSALVHAVVNYGLNYSKNSSSVTPAAADDGKIEEKDEKGEEEKEEKEEKGATENVWFLQDAGTFYEHHGRVGLFAAPALIIIVIYIYVVGLELDQRTVAVDVSSAGNFNLRTFTLFAVNIYASRIAVSRILLWRISVAKLQAKHLLKTAEKYDHPLISKLGSDRINSVVRTYNEFFKVQNGGKFIIIPILVQEIIEVTNQLIVVSVAVENTDFFYVAAHVVLVAANCFLTGASFLVPEEHFSAAAPIITDAVFEMAFLFTSFVWFKVEWYLLLYPIVGALHKGAACIVLAANVKIRENTEKEKELKERKRRESGEIPEIGAVKSFLVTNDARLAKSARLLQTLSGVLLICVAMSLLPFFFVKSAIQRQVCEDTVGKCVWGGTAPKLYFADGIFKDTTCAFDSPFVKTVHVDSSCKITELTTHIDKYSALSTLRVSHNDLTALPAKLASMSSLTEIDVSKNAVDSSGVPFAVADMSSLEIFRVDGNPASLALSWANCSLTRLPRMLIEELDGGELRESLTSIDLSRNNFTDYESQVHFALRQYAALNSIDISFNELSGVLPDGLNLKKLDASFNHIETIPLGAALNEDSVVDLSGNLIFSLPPEVVSEYFFHSGLSLQFNFMSSEVKLSSLRVSDYMRWYTIAEKVIEDSRSFGLDAEKLGYYSRHYNDIKGTYGDDVVLDMESRVFGTEFGRGLPASHGDRVRAVPTWFSTMTSMPVASFDLARLDRIQTGAFSQFISVVTINFSTTLSEIEPGALPSNADTFLRFDASSSSLTSLRAGTLVNLPNLSDLNLFNSDIEYFEEGAIVDCDSILMLRLNSNMIADVVDVMKGFGGSVGVREFHINNNPIVGIKADSFAKFGESLRFLYARQCSDFVGLDDFAFRGLAKLEQLALQKNGIKGAMKKDIFVGLDNLLVLSLYENAVDSVANEAFADLGKLKQVDLSNNQIVTIGQSAWPAGILEVNLNGNAIAVLREGSFVEMCCVNAIVLTGNEIVEVEAGAFNFTEWTGESLTVGFDASAAVAAAARFGDLPAGKTKVMLYSDETMSADDAATEEVCEAASAANVEMVTRKSFVASDLLVLELDGPTAAQTMENMCVEAGRHLISIANAEELAIALEVLSGIFPPEDGYRWVVGASSHTNDYWGWSDGTLWTYSKWREIQFEPENSFTVAGVLNLEYGEIEAVDKSSWYGANSVVCGPEVLVRPICS
jgi:Leucine-rich repeat (LRR) protein